LPDQTPGQLVNCEVVSANIPRRNQKRLIMTQIREVRLPEELCEAAEKKFAQKFSSIEELLTFVLTDLLRDEASQLDHAEQRIIEERLRELGYI
jgi:hypothetical protein